MSWRAKRCCAKSPRELTCVDWGDLERPDIRLTPSILRLYLCTVVSAQADGSTAESSLTVKMALLFLPTIDRGEFEWRDLLPYSVSPVEEVDEVLGRITRSRIANARSGSPARIRAMVRWFQLCESKVNPSVRS
jgi:hypothetical protein